MAKFDTDADQKQLRYMLESRFFTQRGMAREIGIPHGAKISNFVCWLEKFKFIRKTLRQGKVVYEVSSRVELLNFYRRFRNMNDEKQSTHYIGSDVQSAMQYLSDNGAVMCLVSSLQFYDDYTKSPELYAYVSDPALIDKINSIDKGEVKVNFYWYKYSDDSKITDGFRHTSPYRTLMDLYSNNMAYLGERLAKRLWN